MSQIPHPDYANTSVRCGVITVSDTRTPETDRNGQAIQELLQNSGHLVEVYVLLKDELEDIKAHLQQLGSRSDLDVLIFNGGTGISPRDSTYEAVVNLLDKQLPGFGEIFRWLSYQEVGSRAIASRAIAGTYQNTLIFAVPGSTNAVRLAMEKLILPELEHLVNQLRQDDRTPIVEPSH
jgi:molybdopterin adenylyltransferase